MRSDTKAVDLVALLVQTQDCFFVDVIRCDDREFSEPWQLVVVGDTNEIGASEAREISQITGVNANANRSVALIVESQCNSTKVQQTASVIDDKNSKD